MNKIYCLLCLLLFSLSACATFVVPGSTDTASVSGNVHRTSESEDELAALQVTLLSGCRDMLGAAPGSEVNVNGRSYTLDCSGTVNALYYGLGVDFYEDYGLYEGNGVSRINQSFADRGILHHSRIPDVGDVIFWDNTWDRNGDGIFGNDPLTHMGLVVKIDDDGTIYYLHEHFTRGVIIEYMNLLEPTTWKDDSGKVLNSPMYMASYYGNPSNPPRWLSGDLWREFGGILEISRSFGARP